MTTEGFEPEQGALDETAVTRNEAMPTGGDDHAELVESLDELSELMADDSGLEDSGLEDNGLEDSGLEDEDNASAGNGQEEEQPAAAERQPGSEEPVPLPLDDSFGDEVGGSAGLTGDVNEAPSDEASAEAPAPVEPTVEPEDIPLPEETPPPVDSETPELAVEEPNVPPAESDEPNIPVPEASPPPLPELPCAGERFGQSCYLVFDELASWQGAEDRCLSLGGHLASVNTPQEDAFLSNWPSWLGLGVDGSGVWLGGIDLTGTELFVWADGTELDFDGWDQEQPNNGPGYNCIEKRNDGSNAWFDLSCNDQRRFLCELPR